MNKPLKRHPFIIEYSKDHHYGLLMVWKIRQGLKKNIEPHRIAGYVNLFSEMELLPHFEDEEKFLLTLLSPNDDMRIKAQNQHTDLRAMLSDVRNNKIYNATLEKLADLLESHIRFEEREFFPHLQNNIDLDSISTGEEKEPRNQNAIDAMWTDPFWEKENGNISYETVSEAIADLTNRNYTTDFSIKPEEECLVCYKTSTCLSPSEFKIDEIHRFEGDTDPGDEMVIYAISSQIYNMKGYLVNAFGIYADENNSEIVKLLNNKI